MQHVHAHVGPFDEGSLGPHALNGPVLLKIEVVFVFYTSDLLARVMIDEVLDEVTARIARVGPATEGQNGNGIAKRI